MKGSVVISNYEIFKNALLYSLTFRLVGTMSKHSEGDIVTLAVSAFLGTTILQQLVDPLKALADDSAYPMTSPLGKLGHFVATTLVSAGIHMQSNLLAAYAASLYRSDADPLYIALSSALGLMLIWVLGISIGAM